MKNIEILKNKVGYQIFPLTFKDSNRDGIGDLKGIESKLPYLKELGIDIIWLCPIYQSNFADAGYDVIDYYKIEAKFGTMEDFESLIKNAKALGIEIMMDFVINHASTNSYEFQQACLSKTNPYHDFFVWDDQPNLADESIFGGSAWEYVETVNSYYLHIFTKEQADFNFHSENFRNWIYKILEFWIEKGVKYFRFDAIEHIGKTTKPYEIRYGKYNHHFLKEIADKVTSKYEVYIIGESWNVSPEIMKQYCLEDQIVDSFFNFSNLFFDWKNENGSLAKIKNPVDWTDLSGYFKWQESGLITSTSWTNHDVPRAIDRYFQTNLKNRYYAQSAMITLLLTTKGIPFLYQGEEFAMAYMQINSLADFQDQQVHLREQEFVETKGYSKAEYLQANAQGSRDLSRAIMAWDNSDHSGFSSKSSQPLYNPTNDWDKINAAKDLNQKTKSVYQFTKALIALRKSAMGAIFYDFDQIKIIELTNQIVTYQLIKNQQSVFLNINWTDAKVSLANKRKINKIIMSNYNQKRFCSRRLMPFEATIYEGE